MDMPQEIEVWYILPAIRRELSVAMKKLGASQKKIAQKLGITEAAVSQYISEKRGSEVIFSREIKDEILKSAKRIIKKASLIKETQRICNIIKKSGLLCKYHRKFGATQRKCEACLK